MTDKNIVSEEECENEIFPVEPRYHPIHKIPRKIYDFLASSKLAMALLVVILLICVVGVTVWRGAAAKVLIFHSIWFNALLVLLVVNVACCFFGRIWHRRVTIISFGMILFHLSFVCMLLAIVYNSLFSFQGNIRLTEGESLRNDDIASYDYVDKSRFFDFSWLKGETTLIKMQTDYKASGEDKRAAYEISVGEANNKKQGVVYITNKLTHNGFDYFNDKEGYSLLVTISDRQGKELYGAYLPIQSIPLKGGSFTYSTGYKDGNEVKADVIPFPLPPEKPLFAMQVSYEPSKLKERSGMGHFKLFPIDPKSQPVLDNPIADGKAAIGDSFTSGEYVLSVKEVRYWVAMLVRYEPGEPILLASMWVGLAGMIITTLGRMFKKSGR